MLNQMKRAAGIRRVLWIVLFLNLLVVAIKLAVGLTSGALAIIADAFHSVIDSSSNIVGLVAIWIAARPADNNHPYGHQKYENIAAFGIGGLLLAASFEIGQNMLSRLLGEAPPPEISGLTLGLMALTFVINLGVTAYETRAGRQLHSDLLLADAAHTRVDLLVTLSVIAALVGAKLGWAWLDLAAAGFVVILLFRAALEILRNTSYVLTDAAVANPDDVRRIAQEVPGVQHATTVRSRGRVDAGYIDLNIQVNPAMDADQAHSIATEVERRITRNLPGILEAVVHVEPNRQAQSDSKWESIALTLRAIADGLGIGLHDLHIHIEPDERLAIELHLEVSADLTLGQAHALADDFEKRVLESVSSVSALVSHIEPLPTSLPDEAGRLARAEQLRQDILAQADLEAGPGASHNVELHDLDGHLAVTLHVSLPADRPLVEAHATAEAIERRLLARHHQFERVTVHVEPPE